MGPSHIFKNIFAKENLIGLFCVQIGMKQTNWILEIEF